MIALVFYWVSGLGITRRLPPVLHAQLVQGQDRAAGRAGHRGQPGHRGAGPHLGGRPPAAPQVQRQGGRPALAVAVRQRLEGADQGPAATRTWAGCSTRTGPRRRSSAPTCSPTADPPGRSLVPRAGGGLAAAPRADRRPVDDVLARRARPRSSGPAWSASRCCTTSPGRSTRSATRSATRTSRSATSRGTSPGWPSRPSASPGTTCTTPTRPAPGTARSRARST